MSSTPSSNVLTITDNSATIQSMAYSPGTLAVTSGQSYSGDPTVQKVGTQFTISFACDRSGSSSPASSFNTYSGGSGHEYTDASGDDTPGSLNFSFGLDITYTTSEGSGSYTIYVGQGNYLLTNNWWIGAPGLDSNVPNLVLPVDDGVYKLTLPLSGSTSGFTFSAGSVANAYPIKYVFVLMLENRSFDNFFAMSKIAGITAATTANSNSYGSTVYPVTDGAPTSMPTDPGHEFTDVVEQLSGSGASYPSGGPYPAIDMSGFASDYATTTTEGDPPVSADIGDIMACFDTANQLPVIYQLATEFTLCDHWFSSLPGPTWPNRFFIHGASSNGLDHSPSTGEMFEWETFSGFTYPKGSIFDSLTSKGVGYRLYNDLHNSYSDDPDAGSIGGAIAQVSSLKGIQMTDVHAINNLASDLSSGYTAQYTFIEPNYGDVISGSYAGGSSQHPMDDVYGGEAMIKSVYEAIRNSPLWNQSMLIITYDEHGGFYDSVAPGAAPAPNDGSGTALNQYGFTFENYGVRVPAVIVSPWVASGVDHTVYDHASVLATLEKFVGLNPLTDRDAQANDFTHLLLGSARTDCPTTLNDPAASGTTAKPASAQTTMRAQRAGLRGIRMAQPVPQTGNLQGLIAILAKTDFELSDGSEAAKAAIRSRIEALTTRDAVQSYAERLMVRVAEMRAARNLRR